MTWDRFRRPSGACATPHARERTGQFHGQRKARGAQITTGDFGTGYSSFACLWRFPVAARKLPPSAVQAIATHAQDAAMAGAVRNSGRNLKQRSVAERVKTSAQLVFLRLRCFREGQGYYFSRPEGAVRVANLCKARILGWGASFKMSEVALNRCQDRRSPSGSSAKSETSGPSAAFDFAVQYAIWESPF
jgi:predicted signal transduction protein with EAL and GGDEF domain